MSIQKRSTVETNIMKILMFCRKPRTLHYLKENVPLNNNRLKYYMSKLLNEELIIINEEIKNSRCYRKQISLSSKGKLVLREHGVMY